MLIVGMFFFWVAVMSGVFGFADIYSAHLHVAHVVFYSSLLLATLTFSLRLLRTDSIQCAPGDDASAESVAVAGIDELPRESAAEPPAAASCREPVIAGPLAAGMQ